MSVSVQPNRGVTVWRAAVITLVAVLAVAIGATAGSFLLTGRAAAAGAGGTYVPADAPFYVEIRLEPSEAQDEALRELLGRFPSMEGVDLDRPLHDQLVEKLDDMLAQESALELSWSADVAPWFDGRVAFALTAIDADALADPMMAPEQVDMLVALGVRDRSAAESTIARLAERARADGATITESEHRGAVLYVSEGDAAVALTDDAVLAAPTAEMVRAAIDLEADPAGSIAGDASARALVDRLPSDWLAFGIYDLDELMAASFEASAELSGMPPDAFAALLEGQSLRGAFAVSAGGDRIAFDVAAAAPTGALAPANADRGLAAEVPGDALYFADGGNIGQSIAAYVEAMKTAVASDPAASDELATIEAALGADLEELVAWIDDGAIVAGWDGVEPYGGMVLVPNDVDAAQRRIDQLVGFARLGGLDPSMGLTVEEREVAGETVTTIRWADPAAEADPFMPMPSGIAFELTVTGDRVILGLGDRFVERVLTLDAADSLATVERYAAAVTELGGATNAGVVWMDLAGLRDTLVTTLGPMADAMGGGMLDEVMPWLEPFDRVVGVTRLDGDVLVSRGAILFE